MEEHAKQNLFSLNVFLNDLNEKNTTNDDDLERYLSYLSEDPGDFSAFRIRGSFLEKAGWLIFKKAANKRKTLDAVNSLYVNALACSNSYNINNLIVLALIRLFKEEFENESQTKPQILPKLILSLVSKFGEDSSDTYKIINRLLFMKLMFKHLRKFKPGDDLNAFLCHSIEYLNALASKKILLEHLGAKYTAIYLINKYLRCISLLWLNTENKEILAGTERFECSWKVHLNFFMDEFGRIESLGDKTLVFRTLMVIVNMLVESKDDYSDSEDNFNKLQDAFYTSNAFKLSSIYETQQDDTLIVDFNFLCLNIVSKKRHENVRFLRGLFDSELNFNLLFIKMLDSFIGFNYETIIDWLISNETNFLLYFLRYLKYLWNDIDLHNFDNMNRALGMLNANRPIMKQVHFDMVFNFLQLVLSKLKTLKKSFPYNCEPLIKALDKVLDKIILNKQL
jgi:hypothetical protein